VWGLAAFQKKQSANSQIMMRARIAAQGVTVLALMGGVIINIRKKV
jgi:hypothetical protein